jgi:transposase-like protein
MEEPLSNSGMVVFVDDITETEKTTMTERSMNLIDVVRQCGDQDMLRQLAETALTHLMEFEVAQRIGAEQHERSGERVAYRNGYRDRTLDTRLGTLELAIPKPRRGAISRPSWNHGGCRSGPWL